MSGSQWKVCRQWATGTQSHPQKVTKRGKCSDQDQERGANIKIQNTEQISNLEIQHRNTNTNTGFKIGKDPSLPPHLVIL